ncbi:MAG TPA: bestrophin family ion channel [Chryseolinea sp.]|nr:bestrophin family ion channel [Chryseolinea sp.]
MYIKRYFDYRILYFISWRMILYSLFTGLLAIFTYRYLGWYWVAIPWLPVSLIGTAVAFYVGFKNNQSYDRGWEARKVWGSIVNLSRAFAATSKAFIKRSEEPTISSDSISQEIKILLNRHLAWLHALKHAMRQRSAWEHDLPASRRQRRFFEKRINFSTFAADAAACLSREDLERLKDKHNAATQLLDMQSQHLAMLMAKGWIDDYKHVELQRFIKDMYAEQGATERIKNTPLPRQYSTSSHLFILIFTFLLPFAMLHEFDKTTDLMWLMLPFNLVVSWVFSLMEYTGDYSENPFEGLINDVPIYSIVRNIEIDLKELMGEKDVPERMKPVMDVIF